MTPAQIAALERAARRPTAIAAQTLQVLERYHPPLLEATPAGHVLTDAGRRLLERRARDELEAAIEAELTIEARRWADRVDHWRQAVSPVDPRRADFRVARYARHVAACDFDGVEPIDPGWTNADAAESVKASVRTATRVLRDLDETRELAKARGVGVTVSFTADAVIPRPPRTALERAQRDDGTVSLHTYRARRGRA